MYYKGFFFYLISTLAIPNIYSMDIETFDFPDSIKGNLIILHNKCVDETGVQRRVLRRCSEDKQIPDDPAAKCYLKCMHDNFGVDLEKQVASITHHENQAHDINEHVHKMVAHVQGQCDSIRKFLLKKYTLHITNYIESWICIIF